MSGQPPSIGIRLPSTVQKREVMWNIIEPGDPYDIRKSMIAKLPGRRNFMGEHLELVCLLQAAEIERLCEYLDEYRLKFREVERRELDRHSYQVQIKELTMRISDEGNFKAENLKLRQFLRKQSAEFEQLRKYLASAGDEAQLARKYEESLRQVEVLINENEQLRDTLLRSRQEYEQNITNKSLEVEELQRRFKERDTGVSVGRGDTYRLEVESKKLEFENRRLREIGEARARELEQVHVKCKHLIDQVEGQEAQIRQYSALSSTIHQYENRFTLLTQEIQRLNKVLRDKTNQLDDTTNKLRNVEDERRRQNTYLAELQERMGLLEEQNHRLEAALKEGSSNNSAIDESRTIMRAYEGNLEKLSTEISRLNRVLKTKMDELESAEHRASEAEQEVKRAEGVRREVDEFRSRFSELNRKMADYENRIALTTQEIQRLNLVLRRKLEEKNEVEEQLKARTQALQHSESVYSQLEIAYNTQNEYLTRYQARIEQLERETQRQADNTSTKIEIDRLNALLFSKNSEIQRLQTSLQSSRDSPNKQVVADLQSELGAARQANLTLQGSLEQYEQRIILLSQEIDRLNTVIKKASQPLSPAGRSEDQLDPRKVTEYENKLAILSQEIDRLNDNLRAKDGKLKLYQQEISLLRRPQEPLPIDIQQAERLAEAEHRITLYNTEIQRLNDVLAQQAQTISSFELKVSTSTRESQDLKRQLAQYEQSIEELTQRSKVFPPAAQAEIDTLRRRLTEQERRVSEAQTVAREAEFNHRSAVQQSFILEQQVRSYQQREGKLTEGSAKYREYEPKLVALSQEVERLNTILERLTNENQDLKRKLFQANSLKDSLTALEERLLIAAQENQGLRKKLSEGQKSTLLLNQQYQAKLVQANTDREQARRRIQELESNSQALLAQFEAFKRSKSRQQTEISMREAKFQEILVQNEILLKKADQLTVANRKTAELEDRIKLASQEIDRLNSLLRTRTDEARALDDKCRAYQQELGNYQRKVGDLENSTIRELQAKNAALSRENEEFRARVRQLTAEGARVNEFQNKLALTLGEVERLNSVLKGKVDEIEQLNARQRVLEADLERARRRNEDLETTMHRELKNQSAVFEQRITHLSEENEAFRRNSRELADTNRKIPELEHQLGLANAELERLNTILIKYSRETVPALEEKSRLLALECDEQRRRCVELGQINKQGAQAAARVQQLSSENEQIQRRLQEYQSKMGFISAQVERLNGVLRGKLDELATAEAKLRQSQVDNEQLSKRYKDSAQVAKRIHDYEAKLAQLGQEVERLNGLLRSRGEELASAQSRIRILEHEQESLQRRLTDQQALTVELKKHRSGLQDKLNATAAEKEELRKTIRELSDANRRLADYQSRLLLLSQEVERLNTNLKTKTDQLAESENNLRALRREADNKIASLSAELEEYRRRASENMGQQATRLAEYESKMVVMSKEIERLNVVLKETTYQVQNSKGREKQYMLQIERLNNTLRLKVEETVRWEQAHTDLKTKLRNGQEALTASYSQSQKWRQQYLQLVEEHKKSNQHMAEYEKSINKLYQEFERLQSIIQSLKKENYDLKTSLQEAGNLVEKNRVLSAEIDRLLKVIEQQTVDLEELRLALADQSALQKRISEYMALMVVLFAEIESLRRRVKDTEKEIADVRRSSLAPFKV